MTAGIETLKVLSQPGVYEQLESTASRLEEGIARVVSSLNLKLNISRFASLLTVFFTDSAAFDYESVSKADTELFGQFFQQLLSGGIYWPPSQFEAAFISLAHSGEDIDFTIGAIEKAFNRL
jgi:glutamate-1-semialdehyde 2,1-aminomutase